MMDDQPERKDCFECRIFYSCKPESMQDCIQHNYKHWQAQSPKVCTGCGGSTRVEDTRDKEGAVKRKRYCPNPDCERFGQVFFSDEKRS